HADAEATDLVHVGGADAAAGGADRPLAQEALGDLVEGLVVGRDDVRVGADPQPGGVHPARGEHLDLLEQRTEMDHHAVADDRGDPRREDAGGKELELELLPVDDHGVAGVVTAVGLDHVVDPFTEEVGGLALPLVTPLGSDDHDGGHGDSWGRDSTRDWWPRGGHGAAGIVPSTPGRTLRAPAL